MGQSSSDLPVSLSAIPGSLETRGGMPRPDWHAVFEWMESHVSPADRDGAWTQIARDWIAALDSSLDADYVRSESEHFILLAPCETDLPERLLGWCEYSRSVILERLAGVADIDGYGKHVVLAFADADAYYDYIADTYSEEGDFGLSTGIFIDDFYGHIALCMARRGEYERIIAHELTHNLLRHLPLPSWVNEGVTQVLEDAVVGSSYFQVDREIIGRHRAYWDATSIQQFWSGASFYSADEGQELSYHLAEVLLRNLAADYPRQMPQFLNAANVDDAGDAALLEFCRVSLAERVSQFLGPGNWCPHPASWKTDNL